MQIEKSYRITPAVGGRTWLPQHVERGDATYVKLSKWDRSFTAFVLGRSMDNRAGSAFERVALFIDSCSYMYAWYRDLKNIIYIYIYISEIKVKHINMIANDSGMNRPVDQFERRVLRQDRGTAESGK